MNERDLYRKVMRDLNNPLAIEALQLGTMPGRFVKPRDGLGTANDGSTVRVGNPIDLYWTTDCLEMKVVKARTRKGLTFKADTAFGNLQRVEMEKYNALLGVGFILSDNEKNDRLIAIYVIRFWKLRETNNAAIIMDWFDHEAEYTIKGEAYGKI